MIFKIKCYRIDLILKFLGILNGFYVRMVFGRVMECVFVVPLNSTTFCIISLVILTVTYRLQMFSGPRIVEKDNKKVRKKDMISVPGPAQQVSLILYISVY